MVIALAPVYTLMMNREREGVRDGEKYSCNPLVMESSSTNTLFRDYIVDLNYHHIIKRFLSSSFIHRTTFL